MFLFFYLGRLAGGERILFWGAFIKRVQCSLFVFLFTFFQDLDGARHDVLVSLYLDPENKEIVSIFSRLFPGRSITDVMKSHMGIAAARQAEASIRETNSYQELSQHAKGTIQLL